VTGSGIEPSVRAGAADEWLMPGRFALLLGLLILAAFPGVLLGGTTFIIRDFGMFSYPVAYFLMWPSHVATFSWLPWVVTAGQKPVFADDQTVIDAFFQTNIDLRRIVFLPPEARGGVSATQRTAAHVLATKFANQKISIQTEAPAASLVVIAQAHYPAWKAYVDGQPARIWRANYAFQALQVPAGRHQIQLAYEDQKLMAGAALSGLGLLACAGLWGRAHF
jgi:hypothetical protein